MARSVVLLSGYSFEKPIFSIFIESTAMRCNELPVNTG